MREIDPRQASPFPTSPIRGYILASLEIGTSANETAFWVDMIIRNPIFQIGLILLGLYAVIALFSPNVAYDRLPELVPILIFVGLYAVAGIAMIVLLRALKTSQNSMAPTPATLVASMIAVGLFARLIMLGSTPILEDDWLRYLWELSLIHI